MTQPVESGSPSRLFWVDFMRGLSIVLVVVIHVASPLVGEWGDIPFSDWIAGDAYDGLSRISVPLLFMVSGYLLLSRQETIADFYRKRFLKVVIPFLAWSVFYLIWREGFRNYTLINAIKAIVVWILTRPAQYHLWFMYELLAIYLFVPVLRIFVRSADRTHLWYFALLWFVFGPILDLVEHYILDFEVALDLGYLTGFVGYFLLGYLLGQLRPSKLWIWISLAVYIAGALVVIFGTWSVISTAAGNEEFYLNYLRMPVVLMSLSAFIFLKAFGEEVEARPNRSFILMGRWFAQASFGIYLIHVLVIFYLRRGIYLPEISAVSGPGLWMVPVTTAIVILISWFVVAIMQRIPVVKAVVPH